MPISSRRQVSRESRTRPVVDTSCSVNVPGIRATRRSCPASDTANSDRATPDLVPVNQTSFLLGAQARPCTLYQPRVRSRFLPLVSTIAIVPPSSPCSG